jgi:probable rRNA maturation factor
MPVEIVRRDAGKRYPSRNLKKVAIKVLGMMQQGHAELSVALVGNAEMQQLNAQYRHKNYPTDVLSFPADDGFPGAVRLLGDVIISVEKAKEQAKERGRSLDQETVTLLIHGIVHLLGYDHERSTQDARIMGRLEKKIQRALCEQGLLQV